MGDSHDFVASQTALARTGLKRKVLLIPISVGFLCSVVCVGMYFIGVVLQLENVFSARYFIPIFGILMGNMLSSNVIALNTYYSGLKREQQLYRYLLGNGATRAEAQAPFIRQAIIKAFSPLIANISVMGLVAFPGTMIGQILGGSSPNVAIKYQMMIMVITFTASMLSLMITISLASRKSFDAYGKLLPISVEKKNTDTISAFFRHIPKLYILFARLYKTTVQHHFRDTERFHPMLDVFSDFPVLRLDIG